MSTVVIVGAGQAGSELAVALRQTGFGDRIVLVGAERHLPYQRPPLSKAFLRGKVEHEALRTRTLDAYTNAGIEIELDTAAVGIDRRTRSVTLADGRTLRYDKLALTTGGSPRPLRFGPDHIAGRTLHHLDDAIALRQELHSGGTLLIVGGGFIGLETAAAATDMGIAVTLVEAQPRVLARTCPPAVSAFAEREHRNHGVDLRTGVSVRSIARRDGALLAELSDDTLVRADLILTGVGIAPNDTLATTAGLAVDNGVLVDAAARTEDPDIVAAGDCTRQWHGFLGRSVRLESVQNATDQARIAARTLCGKPTERSTAPWFWSDQYDHKLQMAGLPQAGDTAVVRGDPSSHSFTVVYLRDGVITGLHAVNRPRDFTAGRQLVTARAVMTGDEAASEDLPLSELMKRHQSTVERRA
ncbi:NAD(P)/FAD-dependent oxidoreductase [Streptomyces sp. TLI_185]|uniref:NAD(P)/FAD-dependent oxidoreductase n=1 Tax=Streptomyces sp. TLI_185 TaxID=2485151 RepID=UPI000FA3F7A7|nr:FAD-dependent oxidoreductase [Streptomyces sp. TLI_185]RPF39239.1 3-phenylpropionate/trans-cinnamate dioxygenase ferredoxin reductase subunit [Streptomyces sp. TLI_185]